MGMVAGFRLVQVECHIKKWEVAALSRAPRSGCGESSEGVRGGEEPNESGVNCFVILFATRLGVLGVPLAQLALGRLLDLRLAGWYRAMFPPMGLAAVAVV